MRKFIIHVLLYVGLKQRNTCFPRFGHQQNWHGRALGAPTRTRASITMARSQLQYGCIWAYLI